MTSCSTQILFIWVSSNVSDYNYSFLQTGSSIAAKKLMAMMYFLLNSLSRQPNLLNLPLVLVWSSLPFPNNKTEMYIQTNYCSINLFINQRNWVKLEVSAPISKLSHAWSFKSQQKVHIYKFSIGRINSWRRNEGAKKSA